MAQTEKIISATALTAVASNYMPSLTARHDKYSQLLTISEELKKAAFMDDSPYRLAHDRGSWDSLTDLILAISEELYGPLP